MFITLSLTGHSSNLLVSVAATTIYNKAELYDYLDALKTSQPNVDKWISKILTPFLLRAEAFHIPVRQNRWGLPDLGKLGTDMVKFKPTTKLTADLEHAIAWLKTFPPSKDLNFTVPQAVKQGNLLIQTQNHNASGDEGDIQVLHTFKDGFTFVSCLDAQSIKREGKLMNHCVGSEAQGYIRDVAKGTLQIWSLRDPNNNPHCTIEYKVRTKTINQIKGKRNNGITKTYQPYVLEWLKLAEKTNLISTFNPADLMNLGILSQDGVWYDVNHLPSDFTVRGDLTISKAIVTLPEKLNVEGNLYINNSTVTTSNGLVVGGNLSIMATEITLPDGITIGKNLNIHNCSISLPKGLIVEGTLDITDCHDLTSLPEGLTVGKSLYLGNCTSLTKFPNQMIVKANLVITNCPKSLKIPKSIKVGGSITKE